MSLRSLPLFVLSAIFGLAVLAPPAAAQKGPEKVFGGKVMVSDKAYPSYAKSVSTYISKIRKQSKTNFWENKTKGSWKIHFAAFFKRPLPDIEVTVKLYDIGRGKGPRTMIASFEQFVDQRGQRALLSQFTLERKHVGVNRHVLMVVESAGITMATGKFKLLGEEERHSGKVDFSEEDTKKNDDE